jgi:hypothetical protein
MLAIAVKSYAGLRSRCHVVASMLSSTSPGCNCPTTFGRRFNAHRNSDRSRLGNRQLAADGTGATPAVSAGSAPAVIGI